jgi:hypothetical protein
MSPFKPIVIAAALVLAAPALAQDKPPAEPVLEIQRTGKLPCEVKPVMTDEEIVRCGGKPQSKPLPPIPADQPLVERLGK